MPRLVKNSVVFLMLAFTIGIATTLAMREKHVSIIKPSIVEDLAYTDDTGRTSHLSAMREKQVVLHFWATWCVPCRDELPVLIDVARQRRDTMFLWFSVDDDAQAMRDFLAPYHTDAPNIVIISDKERAAASHMHVTGYPESFVVDPGLRLRQHLVGSVNWRNYPF